MGKTYKDERNREEPASRDNDGWKAERKAARTRKKMSRGEWTGKRNERARGED